MVGILFFISLVVVTVVSQIDPLRPADSTEQPPEPFAGTDDSAVEEIKLAGGKA